MAKAKLTVTVHLINSLHGTRSYTEEFDTEDYSDDPNADPATLDLEEVARDILYQRLIEWDYKAEKA
jgi:hypothetical protein